MKTFALVPRLSIRVGCRRRVGAPETRSIACARVSRSAVGKQQILWRYGR